MNKASSSAVQHQDNEYNILMNMLHISVSKHLLDEHFTLVWANDFYYDLIGYTKPEYEALYHNQPDLYYRQNPAEWNKIQEVVTEAIRQGKNQYSLVSRMRRKNDEYLWVKMSATFVDEIIGGKQVAFTVMTDIDNVIQMQKEQSVTYDNLPGFVAKYKIDSDLRLTLLDANQKFIDFFGEGCWDNDKDPIFNYNISHNYEHFEANREKFIAGKPVRFTAQLRDQFGKEAWLQINASRIDWKDGCPVYLALYLDVTNETELRQLQIKLENQARELKTALKTAEQANRAKSDFLSHMSHDIRTPMNAIMGMTDLALQHADNTSRVRNYLKKISLSSQHLLGLINDVLDMSRIEYRPGINAGTAGQHRCDYSADGQAQEPEILNSSASYPP